MKKVTKSESKDKIFTPDFVIVKILNLEIPDEDPMEYDIKATFLDQLVIAKSMTSNIKRTKSEALVGLIEYDPSDYQNMNKFADTPLAVSIQPTYQHEKQQKEEILEEVVEEEHSLCEVFSYHCNIDIGKIFTDVDYMAVEKRMDSSTRSVLHAKSWLSLPLISIEIEAKRSEENAQGHKVLRDTNLLKFTLIGCYNINIPSDDSLSYACITEMPMCKVENTHIVLFDKGGLVPSRFNHTNFYPKWESLRIDEESYARNDKKFFCDNLKEFQNPNNVDLDHIDNKNAVLWTSFHRSLVVKSAEEWLYHHLHDHAWPVEVHVCGVERYCYVTYLDLLKLIYPGEHTVRLAMPLKQVQTKLSPEECTAECFLSQTVSSNRIGSAKTNKVTSETNQLDDTNMSSVASVSDGDGSNPFILVEIKLARPLRKSSVPPSVTNNELMEMLRREEQSAQPREVSGCSHTDRHWRETVSAAAQLLYTLPKRDSCTFDHDLITSKTRVEIESSFWQEAAHYVNNNFNASQFLESDEAFEELTTMAHIHMMRAATETILGAPDFDDRGRLLQAARQARQMQDTPHAIELYLQLLTTYKRDSDIWRELATCFQDVDKKLAHVCIDKALKFNPRHPLSLLLKACLVVDEDIEQAEVFFLAILSLYPFCTLLWIIASAYYFHRGLHNISEKIMEYVKRVTCEDIPESPLFPRAWGCELGDWWDHTPILAGCTPYYDVADLLLRIRGIALAEVCVALSLPEAGATPMYYHLLALCCRLRGEVTDALCHLQHASKRNGACYLYSLEGECHFVKGNWTAAKMYLENSVYYSQPFSTLLAISSSSLSRHDINVTRSVLLDLVRRQPSAYAWTKLAQFFMMNKSRKLDTPGSSGDHDLSTRYIVACAEQALKCDRYFQYAWSILAKTVQHAARRVYCRNMAIWCGHLYKLPFKMYPNLPRGDLMGKTMDCRCQEKEEL
ncbi:uncharacterized protein LOC121736608 [Aricia agestis]|uniref:uncharacterized protein LOC121736608 n=1 Tax=Aricia agestis TaxID=91739 RepID=UPI001C208D96|nr:uncharacterized protein LOC121736608 [Aricia agestis]